MVKIFENYFKMSSLFILRNIEIESEYNAKLFYNNIQGQTRESINYFNAYELHKDITIVKDVLCLCFFQR